MLERCRKSLQYHHVACYDHLPLTNLSGHALESLSKHRLYARLPKQPEHYLVDNSDIFQANFLCTCMLHCLICLTFILSNMVHHSEYRKN